MLSFPSIQANDSSTTARIRPLTLVPRNSGKVFASKLVDYAIVLRCQPDIHRRILSLLNQHDHDHPAINHTYCAPVRYQPITVNIEVKAPGGGDSMVQHMVWVGAHLRKLGQLANGKVDICIPMVSVQGHSWRIHYAYQKEENGVIVRLPSLLTPYSFYLRHEIDSLTC